ncbi:MAG: cation diffusion facilitator family transporter [Alicyclobacillus sp.]|nr:cation diffusion facilitator family transporter [Alicyclobacillus sp.]
MSEHHHNHTHAGHTHGPWGHAHAPAGKMQRAFWLTLLVLAAEIAAGWLAHSLALWSDAGHVLTDLGAIGLSWYTLQQAQRPANPRLTFGYHRSGILAALLNGLTLLAVTLFIVVEAYRRLQHPQPVAGGWMLAGALLSLMVNLYLALSLRHEHDLNVRSAVLHMVGDAAASAAVVVAALAMSVTGWYALDPLLSAGIAVLIAWGAWRVLRQTVHILMEGMPAGIELQQVVAAVKSVPGVHGVHDIHVWSISSGRNALSCHLVIDGNLTVRESQAILGEVEHRLLHLGIGHVTLQAEDASTPHNPSLLCAAEAVHLAEASHGSGQAGM